jgi:hypothetical protein
LRSSTRESMLESGLAFVVPPQVGLDLLKMTRWPLCFRARPPAPRRVTPRLPWRRSPPHTPRPWTLTAPTTHPTRRRSEIGKLADRLIAEVKRVGSFNVTLEL